MVSRTADPQYPGQATVALYRRYRDLPTFSDWPADALRTSGLTHPGIGVEGCPSAVRKSRLPGDSAVAMSAPSRPFDPSIRLDPWQTCGRDRAVNIGNGPRLLPLRARVAMSMTRWGAPLH